MNITEVEEKLKTVFKDFHNAHICNDCIIVEIRNNETTYATMKSLAYLFDTDDISTEFFHNTGGCSTCDYGSYDEITYYITLKKENETTK